MHSMQASLRSMSECSPRRPHAPQLLQQGMQYELTQSRSTHTLLGQHQQLRDGFVRRHPHAGSPHTLQSCRCGGQLNLQLGDGTDRPHTGAYSTAAMNCSVCPGCWPAPKQLRSRSGSPTAS